MRAVMLLLQICNCALHPSTPAIPVATSALQCWSRSTLAAVSPMALAVTSVHALGGDGARARALCRVFHPFHLRIAVRPLTPARRMRISRMCARTSVTESTSARATVDGGSRIARIAASHPRASAMQRRCDAHALFYLKHKMHTHTNTHAHAYTRTHT
jgi:hypothetical protein